MSKTTNFFDSILTFFCRPFFSSPTITTFPSKAKENQKGCEQGENAEDDEESVERYCSGTLKADCWWELPDMSRVEPPSDAIDIGTCEVCRKHRERFRINLGTDLLLCRECYEQSIKGWPCGECKCPNNNEIMLVRTGDFYGFRCPECFDAESCTIFVFSDEPPDFS